MVPLRVPSEAFRVESLKGVLFWGLGFRVWPKSWESSLKGCFSI